MKDAEIQSALQAIMENGKYRAPDNHEVNVDAGIIFLGNITSDRQNEYVNMCAELPRPTNRLPGNVNISFKGRSGEGLMHMLDLKGICVSTGSACDSVNQQVSHVIKAINVPDEYSEGTIRVTFGKENSEQDVLDIANALIKMLRM